jgi:hypothetical protein
MLMKVLMLFMPPLLPSQGRFLMRRAEIRFPAGFGADSATRYELLQIGILA